MSEAFKYIVFEATHKDGDKYEIPVMFPKYLTHVAMCEASKQALFRDAYTDLTPGRAVAAGFCGIGPKGIFCRGESETLKMKSRGEQDEKLFAQYNTYGHGRLPRTSATATNHGHVVTHTVEVNGNCK